MRKKTVLKKMVRTEHVVTNYGMPLPGIWRYVVQCTECKRKVELHGDRLPVRGYCKLKCRCTLARKEVA
jgi:hypothetical protein